MKADVVFRNATIIDGSGAAGWQGDLAVTDDRITALGQLSQYRAGTEHDCTGVH